MNRINGHSIRYGYSLAWETTDRLRELVKEKLGITSWPTLDWFDWAINIDYFSQPDGSGLLELFPSDCSCEHPGNCFHHIHVCLNREEIEEFERKFSALVEKERIAVEKYKAEIIQELEEEARIAIENVSEEWVKVGIKNSLELFKNLIISNSKSKGVIDRRVELFFNSLDQLFSSHSTPNLTNNFAYSSDSGYSSSTSDYDNNDASTSSSSFSDASSTSNTSENKPSSQPTNSSANQTNKTKNNPPAQEEEKPKVKHDPTSTSLGSGGAPTSLPNSKETEGMVSATANPSAPASNSFKEKPHEQSNPSTNQDLALNKQKQQIIQKIEEQLAKLPNSNLHEFANWRQEIESIQNLAALTAYQNNLLANLAEQKEQQLAQSKVADSARQEKNLLPWIGLGVIILGGVVFLLLYFKKFKKQ